MTRSTLSAILLPDPKIQPPPLGVGRVYYDGKLIKRWGEAEARREAQTRAMTQVKAESQRRSVAAINAGLTTAAQVAIAAERSVTAVRRIAIEAEGDGLITIAWEGSKAYYYPVGRTQAPKNPPVSEPVETEE